MHLVTSSGRRPSCRRSMKQVSEIPSLAAPGFKSLLAHAKLRLAAFAHHPCAIFSVLRCLIRHPFNLATYSNPSPSAEPFVPVVRSRQTGISKYSTCIHYSIRGIALSPWYALPPSPAESAAAMHYTFSQERRWAPLWCRPGATNKFQKK